MKIIHCADIHLDSKLSANLDKEKARKRKGEILHTFERMISFAAQNEVSAILLAGDVFDGKRISQTVKNAVIYAISQHPRIQFFYLKGNHDRDSFIEELDGFPDNLKLFGHEWKSYELAEGQVVITGLELNSQNNGTCYHSLVLDTEKFNIVMLHGQESEGNKADKAEIIRLKQLRDKSIDYLALGHIHRYKSEKLDQRGWYCYPGCLEGRGFDECGEHGFVLLDIDVESRQYTREFHPFAQRCCHALEVDISGLSVSAQILQRVWEIIENKGCREEDLVKIVLKGEVDPQCEKDMDYLLSSLEPYFYFVKIYDETGIQVNMEECLLDPSLKGEFVRQVLSDSSLSEVEKRDILRIGLQALLGEEVV